MMKKRLISAVCALVMTGGMIAAPLGESDFSFVADVAASAETLSYGDFEYAVLKEGTVKISKYKGTGGVVEIPDSIDGKPVTRIGYYAFNGCKKLISVTIPDSVTKIEDGAFWGCSLTNVTIPAGVTSIAVGAFSNCSSLTAVDVDNDNMNYVSLDGVLYNKDISELIYCPGGKTSVSIPDSVTCIGQSAFGYCHKLTHVDIPDSVETIGSFAFELSALTSITVPESVTSLGACAFQWTDLESANILADIKTIPKSIFDLCVSLESVNIPDSVEKIDEGAFKRCKKLESIDIPDGVKTIGNEAFSMCSSLKSIDLPDGVTSIGSEAFNCCTNLESVHMPDKVTSIGDWAFSRCTSLTEIDLPDTLTSIGKCAFSGCSELSSVTIPGSVKTIQRKTFYDCSRLENVTISEGVETIEDRVFLKCTNLETITFPKSVKSIGEHAFGFQINSDTGKEIRLPVVMIYCYKDSVGESYAKSIASPYVFLDAVTSRTPNVISIPGSNCANLEWNAVPDAEKYAVCGLVNGKWRKFSETVNTSYTIKNLKAGTNYRVAVIAMFNGEWNVDFFKAITINANESVASKYPRVTDVVYNYEVEDIVNKNKYHQFKVYWDAVDGAEKYGVAVFIANKWKIFTQDIPANITKFTSPKLEAGKTYKLVVCAKVDGKWDIDDLESRAFSVSVE